MLIRIVRMTFHPEHTEDFLDMFNTVKHKIRGFEGCEELILWQDYHLPHVLATYSLWESDHHLNAYKKSELFKKTWSQTKQYFADKPLAYSFRQKMMVS